MGALTLKPFSDESREWELFENESIDITDSFGTSLRLSIRENQVFLAEPYSLEFPWLTDRGRLFFEGYFEPNNSKDLIFSTLDWSFVFDQMSSTMYFLDHLKFIKSDIKTKFFTIVFKRLCDENIDMLNKLKNRFSTIRLRSDSSYLPDVDLESLYQINSNFTPLKLKFSSLAILIGTNTRYEGYKLNLILRQRFLKGNFTVLSLGPLINLTFPVNCISSNTNVLFSICEGSSQTCRELINSTMPVFLTNFQIFRQTKYIKLNNMLKVLKNAGIFSEGISMMADKIESTGINDFKKYKPLKSQDFNNSNVLYYVNIDLNNNSQLKALIQKNYINSVISEKQSDFKSNFVFAQSDLNIDNTIFKNILTSTLEAKKALYFYNFLPVKGIFEENSTYKTVKGKVKKVSKVLNHRKNAKLTWQLLRYMYFFFSKNSFFVQKKDATMISSILENQLNQSNFYYFTDKATISLSSISSSLESSSTPFMINNKYFIKNFKKFKVCFKKSKIKYWLDDFFIGGNKDNLSTNALTLTKCSSVLRAGSTNFF